MSKQNNERDVVLALVSGAALGTRAVLLVSPEKGEVLRNRIKLRANRATKNKTIQETMMYMFDDINIRAKLKSPSFYFKMLFN